MDPNVRLHSCFCDDSFTQKGPLETLFTLLTLLAWRNVFLSQYDDNNKTWLQYLYNKLFWVMSIWMRIWTFDVIDLSGCDMHGKQSKIKPVWLTSACTAWRVKDKSNFIMFSLLFKSRMNSISVMVIGVYALTLSLPSKKHWSSTARSGERRY